MIFFFVKNKMLKYKDLFCMGVKEIDYRKSLMNQFGVSISLFGLKYFYYC